MGGRGRKARVTPSLLVLPANTAQTDSPVAWHSVHEATATIQRKQPRQDLQKLLLDFFPPHQDMEFQIQTLTIPTSKPHSSAKIRELKHFYFISATARKLLPLFTFPVSEDDTVQLSELGYTMPCTFH